MPFRPTVRRKQQLHHCQSVHTEVTEQNSIKVCHNFQKSAKFKNVYFGRLSTMSGLNREYLRNKTGRDSRKAALKTVTRLFGLHIGLLTIRTMDKICYFCSITYFKQSKVYFIGVDVIILCN